MPYSDRRIRCAMRGVLRAGIWCAITPISPLFIVVLRLGLHHLTASGILRMAAFVTLYEAYMGIEPHFKLGNYFFRIWVQQGSGVEAAALGSVDNFVRFGRGVDPYFHLSTSSPPDGWWKIWFFLRNDTDVPLPMFTVSHHVPQTNWGSSEAQRDLYRQ
jgi:hypothetical protein